MPTSSKDQPKFLTCTRALALLTGLAGSVTVSEGTARASADDAGTLTIVAHDGAAVGVVVMPEGCACDLGEDAGSRSVSLVTGLVGAGLIARRRRRSDVP